MYGSPTVEISSQRFRLLPEKALFWEQQSAILVTDTHFGKAATFRNRGIPVPAGTTDVMLDRLTKLLHQSAAKQIFFLGDFVHSHTRHAEDFETELKQWRRLHHDVAMTLVMGNHDLGQRTLFDALDLKVVQEPFSVGDIALCHYPDTPITPGVYKLAGHIHPAIKLGVAGDSTGKLPCFHFSKTVGVLPAFGEFTGMAVMKRDSGDRVFVIADGTVIDLSSKTTTG